MKYLGIDFGSKRIGLAVSDESESFAFPLKVLENSPKILDEVCILVKENNIGKIVVGESRNFKQEENEVMKDIKIFTNELSKQSGLEVLLHPEFMTSREAERLQGKNDMLDASAAAIILKHFLETKK